MSARIGCPSAISVMISARVGSGAESILLGTSRSAKAALADCWTLILDGPDHASFWPNHLPNPDRFGSFEVFRQNCSSASSVLPRPSRRWQPPVDRQGNSSNGHALLLLSPRVTQGITSCASCIEKTIFLKVHNRWIAEAMMMEKNQRAVTNFMAFIIPEMG